MEKIGRADVAFKGTNRGWLVVPMLLLLGVCLPLPVRAQEPSLRFTHLSGEQGLSHDGVLSIVQDQEGFLWFGTYDGLNRYDGYTFTTYRHLRSDPHSLSESTIHALYQDRSGTLWIGTSVGLDSFTGEGNRFAHYPEIEEEVSVIYEDTAGVLWIGTAGSGLFRYDRAANQFTQYLPDPADPHSLSDDTVLSIYEDSAGTLWLGTMDNGLDAFDRSRERFTHYRHDPEDPHSLNHDRVTAIVEDDSGVLWVGTASEYEPEDGGLHTFDRDSQQFTRYLHDPRDPGSLSSNHVRSIHQDRTGTLWVATDDGLNVFDRAAGRFVRYIHDPLDPYSLSGNNVTTIYEDLSGILWLGTENAGINKYARIKERFRRYQHDPFDPNSLPDAPVGSIWEDHTGLLWVGTQGAGLVSLDRSTYQFTHYTHDPEDPHSLGHDYARALYQDADGFLWVGTSRGLDRFDPTTGQFHHYVHDPDNPDSLSPGAVKVIIEDHTHNLWIGLEEPGSINKFDPTAGTFSRYEYDPDNLDRFVNTYGVRAICEDSAGQLWLGTYNGLVRFDPASETFTQYRHDPQDPHSLSHDFVWSIYEDPEGILWIATGGGLNRFDRSSGQFTVYTIEDGLSSDHVSGILADEQGFLWLSTDGGGVSRFDPRTGTFRNYDVRDGLVSNAFLVAVHHRSKSGEMFFGAADGLNAFYPAEVKDNPLPPPVVLTSFRKFDQVVEFDVPLSDVDDIELSYEDNFFSFEFAALDYTDPAKNQYAYQLQGFDPDWIYCGSRRYASYTNLSPGEYVFRVKGSNNDGVWNEEGHSVRITITPPFWERWWFRILSGGILLGIVCAVVGVRMRSVAILRKSEERFRVLFENAPLGVFELDMTSTPPTIVRANRWSEQVYGWPREALSGTTLDGIFPSESWPALQQRIDAWRVGETISVESTGRRRDGTEFPIHVSATAEPGSAPKRAILAIEDITAEKQRRSEEEAIAEERRRIAREIHDGLAQDLAGLRFRIGLWHNLVDSDPAQMHAELGNLQELLAKNIREVRRSIFALRPVALDELGFFPALRQFIDEFGEQNQLHVDLQIEGPPERLPTVLEPVLFRIIQEALNNVSKHAQAQMVWIRLDTSSPAAVSLMIRDDGGGFDPAQLDHLVQRGHLGLRQMRERVERLQGHFELRSQPGEGTEIQTVFPLQGE